jgi:hypothetical protein
LLGLGFVFTCDDVGNNPLKYIDPTGHVKKTPEQEAQEEKVLDCR